MILGAVTMAETMNRNKVLGVELKKLRLSKNLRLIDVANSLNKTKGAVCAYERGSVSFSYDTLCDLCDILDVDIIEFLKNINFPKKKKNIRTIDVVLNSKDSIKKRKDSSV